MITKNASATLQDTLEALKNWPHVVIYDTGSTDETLSIIKNYPQIILQQGPFEGFGKARNKATSFAKTPWVFHLDADEVPSKDLLAELGKISLIENCVYSVRRDNYFMQKHMKGCSGWYPDDVVRLFHKQSHSYSLDLVHEKVICEKNFVIQLQNSLKHTPYQSVKQMLDKMNHYSELFAKNTSKKANFLSPFLHAFHAFFKSYILKNGISQGFRGYILSKYIADTAFYKYLKLWTHQKMK